MNVIQELTGATPKANLVPGLNLDEVYSRTEGATTSYFLDDALNSTIALTDGTGTVQTQYTYEPFGNTTQSGTANNSSYQYTGRENDGTGLYYYRARYYSPATQRFISQDPIGFAGGDVNLYTYVLNNPINFIDPYGLWAIGDPLPQGLVDATAGFGDALSFGFTDWVRDQMDTNDAVDKCSGAYSGGKYAGYGWGAATGVGAAGRALQVEVNVLSKGNVLKIISKRLKMGFRVDPAHHGKPWGHTHRWRW